MDKGKICSEALSCFSKTEQQSSAFAAAIRAKAVLALYNQQERQLVKKGLMKPLLEIEMPMARVLSEMECKGICMDRRVYNLSRLPLVRRQEEVLTGLNAKMESAFKPSILCLFMSHLSLNWCLQVYSLLSGCGSGAAFIQVSSSSRRAYRLPLKIALRHLPNIDSCAA